VILVSSGAIRARTPASGLTAGRLKLEESQAAAAVGQIRLAHAYKELLEQHDIAVAQLLLTLSDTEERRRYLNAAARSIRSWRSARCRLINENDTVATAEIRYGDNDRLAARVAQMTGADWPDLAVGLSMAFTPRIPASIPMPSSLRACLEVTPQIEAIGRRPAARWARGGMLTKIAAAKIAVGAGCHMCIAKGAQAHPLKRIETGERCTWFVPSSTPVATRSSGSPARCGRRGRS